MSMAKLIAIPLLLFFFLLFLTFIPSLQATTTTKTRTPISLVAPIHKDPSTLQYIITTYLKTPFKQTKLVLDLGADFAWVNCDKYRSSTYKFIRCGSSLANKLGLLECMFCNPSEWPAPFCANNSVLLQPKNPIKPVNSTATKIFIFAPVLVDTFALPALIKGSTQGPLTSINNFVFSCADTPFLDGLAKGVAGLAGLGRSNISLPVQFNRVFSSSPKSFAICLSNSKSKPGVAFFSTKGPYNFLPGIDIAKSIVNYTPLILNPVGKDSEYYRTKKPSSEYYIGLSSIKLNGEKLALNQTLLTINGEDGSGGTKISTIVPYTKLEASIYKAFTMAFLKAAASSPFNLTATKKPVMPFKVCYAASDVKTTEMGPNVPIIDLVLHREDVVWKIYGSNSMVRIKKKEGNVDLWCLGFVDGTEAPKFRLPGDFVVGPPSIVIGGHQVEDNLLQFDLETMKLGFSSSILSKGTNCANFKFSA